MNLFEAFWLISSCTCVTRWRSYQLITHRLHPSPDCLFHVFFSPFFCLCLPICRWIYVRIELLSWCIFFSTPIFKSTVLLELLKRWFTQWTSSFPGSQFEEGAPPRSAILNQNQKHEQKQRHPLTKTKRTWSHLPWTTWKKRSKSYCKLIHKKETSMLFFSLCCKKMWTPIEPLQRR